MERHDPPPGVRVGELDVVVLDVFSAQQLDFGQAAAGQVRHTRRPPPDGCAMPDDPPATQAVRPYRRSRLRGGHLAGTISTTRARAGLPLPFFHQCVTPVCSKATSPAFLTTGPSMPARCSVNSPLIRNRSRSGTPRIAMSPLLREIDHPLTVGFVLSELSGALVTTGMRLSI